MKSTTGQNAGKVWKIINTNKSVSMSKISKETGLTINEVNRAIGWLDREDKITTEQQGRTELLSLNE